MFLFYFFGRLAVPALQENFQPLLGLLRESVQLNLAPPGHFLLLRYCMREESFHRAFTEVFHCSIPDSEGSDLPTAP